MERHDIPVAGIPTHYRVAGSGTPTLLVHGGDPRTFGHGADWDLAIPELAASLRVFAPDRLGQGRTGNPGVPERLTLEDAYEHLTAFVDELGIAPVVVGHSRGALLALRLAIERPGIVPALVLVDSNSLSTPRTRPTDFYAGVFDGLPDEPTAAEVGREALLNSYDPSHVTPGYLGELTGAARLPDSIVARRISAQPSWRTAYAADIAALRERLLARVDEGALTKPALVVWAREDPSAQLESGIDLFDRLAAAPTSSPVELHVVRHSGHYPQREQARAFSSVVREFVARVVDSSP